ncbi:MAG: hypothetical protein HOD04_00635 [Elusimicrobiaceae bacterium]|nr:hypothetical protein [Elusimicrobiaceae bacterium]MBT4439428.1 hypothetical protein [Elusimicrobiaceae bacterium]MBT6715230.1 hypothetical protein [Elusimicrobiaceae bacterium]
MAKIDNKEFETKVTNFDGDKYNMSVLSFLWAKQLKKREEFNYKPHSELIKAALTDILSGAVTKEHIIEISAKNLQAEAKSKQSALKEKEKNEPLTL